MSKAKPPQGTPTRAADITIQHLVLFSTADDRSYWKPIGDYPEDAEVALDPDLVFLAIDCRPPQ